MARAWKLAYSAKIGMRKLAPAGQNRAGSNKRLCWKMADESADAYMIHPMINMIMEVEILIIARVALVALVCIFLKCNAVG